MGGVLGFVYAEQERASRLPRRPDLKRSKPQWAANISYAIPFDDSGANVWKYGEVISQEIHPRLGGEEEEEKVRFGAELGGGTCQA